MRINLFGKLLLISIILILAGQLLYITQAWADTMVIVRILVQDTEYPDIFNPYEGAELELKFWPTEEIPKYGKSNSESIYAEFIKKYPPVTAWGTSNLDGEVKFALTPGIYRLKEISLTNEPQELLGLELDWDLDTFTVTEGQVTQLPDIKFVQRVEMIFPKDGDVVSINDNEVKFCWKSYHKATHYRLEIRSAKGGFDFHIEQPSTEIKWKELKEKIEHYNQTLSGEPKWQVILEPNQEYQLTIRACDAEGRQLSSSWPNFNLTK